MSAGRFRRVVDALVAHVGDMQQAVDTAQVNEHTLDGAVDDLAFGERQDQAGTLFGAQFFEKIERRDTTMLALAVHLQDLERLRQVHQRGDIAHRADIDLRAGPATARFRSTVKPPLDRARR